MLAPALGAQPGGHHRWAGATSHVRAARRGPDTLPAHKVAQWTVFPQDLGCLSLFVHPNVPCLLGAGSREAEPFAAGPQDAVNLGELLL